MAHRPLALGAPARGALVLAVLPLDRRGVPLRLVADAAPPAAPQGPLAHGTPSSRAGGVGPGTPVQQVPTAEGVKGTNGGFRGEIPLSRFPIIAWSGIRARAAPLPGEGPPRQDELRAAPAGPVRPTPDPPH